MPAARGDKAKRATSRLHGGLADIAGPESVRDLNELRSSCAGVGPMVDEYVARNEPPDRVEC